MTDPHPSEYLQPRLIEGTPSEPLVTTRSRGWNGMELEFHQGWRGAFIAEYPFHMVSVQLSGTRDLLQRRGGRSVSEVTGPGNVIITPMGGPKQWCTNESSDFSFAVVKLSPELFNGVLEKANGHADRGAELLDNFGTRDEVVQSVATRLMAESQTNEIAQGIYVESLVNELCVHLLRRYSAIGALSEPSPSKLSRSRLQRTFEFIDANLSSDLTITNIAEMLCMSPSHFARSFKLSTGVAPHQFVLKRRIEFAAQLLRNSTRPIAYIAQQAGFSTASHFTATFARVVGETPRRFRRER